MLDDRRGWVLAAWFVTFVAIGIGTADAGVARFLVYGIALLVLGSVYGALVLRYGGLVTIDPPNRQVRLTRTKRGRRLTPEVYDAVWGFDSVESARVSGWAGRVILSVGGTRMRLRVRRSAARELAESLNRAVKGN